MVLDIVRLPDEVIGAVFAERLKGFVGASGSSTVWQFTGPAIPFGVATAAFLFGSCLLLFDNAVSPNVWAEE